MVISVATLFVHYFKYNGDVGDVFSLFTVDAVIREYPFLKLNVRLF